MQLKVEREQLALAGVEIIQRVSKMMVRTKTALKGQWKIKRRRIARPYISTKRGFLDKPKEERTILRHYRLCLLSRDLAHPRCNTRLLYIQ